MKIAIIGYSGSGKSTLARKLGEINKIPVLHLDMVHWIENWNERECENSREIVLKFMENENWVIDGNYWQFYGERRLFEADKIIFFDFPVLISFYQAFLRYLKNINRTRIDMAQGCKEKFDWEFISWLLFDGRTKAKKQKYKKIVKTYKDKVIILKNRNQVDKFLALQ